MTGSEPDEPPLDPRNRHYLFRPGERLRLLKRLYEAGIAEALHPALQLSLEAEGPLPEWIESGMLKHLHAYFRGETYSRKRLVGGVSRSPDKIRADFIRWQIVDKLRAEGKTLEGAIDCAPSLLPGLGQPIVTSSAVKNSYYQVEKDLKDPEMAWAYFNIVIAAPD